jgi:lipoate-protein ligase A
MRSAGHSRRPTGGGAILHHEELTYGLALPAGTPWDAAEGWLCRFHHAVAAALLHFRVEARVVSEGEDQQFGPFFCFQHQTPGDLLVADQKVVGSAQRRPHGATLQHGSILLRRSPLASALPGIADLTGVCPTVPELEQAIVEELVRTTEWSFEPGHWTTAERRAVAELDREKYRTAEWNEKR